jgi:ATP-binding cassette, subfamily B, putative efflux pump
MFLSSTCSSIPAIACVRVKLAAVMRLAATAASRGSTRLGAWLWTRTAPKRTTGSESASSAARAACALPRFLRYVKPYWPLIAGATLCGILKFTLPAAFAVALRFMTDRLVPQFSHAPAPTDPVFRFTADYLDWMAAKLPAAWNMSGPWSEFNILVVTLFGVYCVWAVAMYFRSYWADLAGHRLILDLRSDLFQHIQRLSHSFFNSRQSGAIVSRVTSDIHVAQNFVGATMTNVWMDLAACFFYLALLLAMDWRLALAALAVLPLHIVCMRVYGGKAHRTSKKVQEAWEEFSGDLNERIGGFALVKSFAAETREARGFFSRARDLHNLVMSNARVNIFSSTIVHWLTEVATLGLVWYGGYRVFHGQATIGEIVAFIPLVQQLYNPINRLSDMNRVVHSSLAAIERVFEVFDTQPEVRERAGAKRLPRVAGAVRFEHVSFGYCAQRRTLDDINLDIQPGEMIALVGLSGAGKTTLVQLLPRFFDPHEGRILIDGVDLRDVKLRSLRSQIGTVAQDTVLFSGTIRENILYGNPDATEVELKRVAQAAHVDEFIGKLAEGYETVLGERGAKLSGGQRQRVAIARAFLGDPRVLILDEATSALDSESEYLIQDALKRLMENRTSVVIAHRLSTILHADRIVVMDQGRIVQIGPHEKLLAEGGLYRRLCERQFRFTPQIVKDVSGASAQIGAVAAG